MKKIIPLIAACAMVFLSATCLASVAEPGAGIRIWREPVTGMEFVWVPGGCYEMGCGIWSGYCDEDEKPVHRVCLDDMWMGRTEVTRGQWLAVMGDTPSGAAREDDLPVNWVSWNDIQRFIERLNALSGTTSGFRLPSEAQWEYACRSGGRPEEYAGGDSIDQVAWYLPNSGNSMHPVGSKLPNGLGLHDMSGNVAEWCQDLYAKNAYARHETMNPLHEGRGEHRVIRGGGWFYSAPSVRCGNRNDGFHATKRYGPVGFRLIMEPR